MRFIYYLNIKSQNKITIIVLLNIVLPLLVGGFIYVLFRPTYLNMFSWLEAIGLTNTIHDLREQFEIIKLHEFVEYNLPMGLWIYAFCFSLLIYFKDKHISAGRFWVGGVLFISILSEIGQLFDLVPGTFDFVDIITFTTFFFASLLVNLFVGQKKDVHQRVRLGYPVLIASFFIFLAYGCEAPSFEEESDVKLYTVEEAKQLRRNDFYKMHHREPNKHEMDSISRAVDEYYGIKKKSKKKKLKKANDSIQLIVSDTIKNIENVISDTITSDTIRH